MEREGYWAGTLLEPAQEQLGVPRVAQHPGDPQPGGCNHALRHRFLRGRKPAPLRDESGRPSLSALAYDWPSSSGERGKHGPDVWNARHRPADNRAGGEACSTASSWYATPIRRRLNMSASRSTTRSPRCARPRPPTGIRGRVPSRTRERRSPSSTALPGWWCTPAFHAGCYCAGEESEGHGLLAPHRWRCFRPASVAYDVNPQSWRPPVGPSPARYKSPGLGLARRCQSRVGSLRMPDAQEPLPRRWERRRIPVTSTAITTSRTSS